MIPEDLRCCIVYRCVAGSRAYGLDRDDSDVDLRGCYVAPAELQWSMKGAPEQLVDDQTQECYWEFEKMIKLALKSNPNVLECLNSPIVEILEPPGEELLRIKDIFPSKLALGSYLGYADGQFTRLQNAKRADRSVRTKHAMHLIRLMLSGLHLLQTGKVLVDVSEHRELLLSIRDGRTTWERVDQMRNDLRDKMEQAALQTPLPEKPNWEIADELLIRVRRSIVRT